MLLTRALSSTPSPLSELASWLPEFSGRIKNIQQRLWDLLPIVRDHVYQLGHSDPRITLAIYSHVIGDSHRQAVEKRSTVLDISWPQMATNEEGTEIKGQLIQ